MSENFVPRNLGRAAALFKGVLLGVVSGAPRISRTGRLESYTDCSDSGLALWAGETGAVLTVSLTIDNAAAVLTMLADGSDITLPEPGADLSAAPGELLVAALDGSVAFRFPRATVTSNWSYQWNADTPHEMTVEFRALPDTSRLLMQSVPGGASPVAVPNNFSWAELENSLVAELSAAFPWSGLGAWYAGDIEMPNGGRLELTSEAPGRTFYGRELTFELSLRSSDRAAVRGAAGALAANLPWHNRGGFYEVELASCRAEKAVADTYAVSFTLRALSPR